MKKYLVSLIPFIFCTILAFIYGEKTPKDYPDPSFPYQTEYVLDYLSVAWFFIGIIMSSMFISMFMISDLFDYIMKLFNKRESDK